MKTAIGLLLVSFAGLSQLATAQQQHSCKGPLLGTWKLQSWTREYMDTHDMVQPYGAHPNGYLSYGPDCRMYAIIVREGRQPPVGDVPTNSEKIELFSGLLAYGGTYTVEGNRVTHHVDISWNQGWTGTAQLREFKIEGDVLHIRSAPSKNPTDGRVTASTLSWIRVR